jgi:hypothetical protein
MSIGGIDGFMPSSAQLLLRPPDAGAVEEMLANLSGRLAAIGAEVTTETVEGVEITTLDLPDTVTASYAVSDGVVIIGLSPDDVRAALEANASGATLGSSDAYARAFAAAGAHAGAEIFIDVAALAGPAAEALALPDDARDILSGIGTLAVTLPSRDDQIEFHAVLTVDEP